MKRLILIRHSKTEKVPGKNDFDRELLETGIYQSNDSGEFLKKYLLKENISIDLFMTSPAVRAYNTSKIICDKIQYPVDKLVIKEKIYPGTLDELLYIITSIEDKYNNVILCGHNDSISELREYVLSSKFEELKTGSVSIIQLKINTFNTDLYGKGKLLEYYIPNKSD